MQTRTRLFGIAATALALLGLVVISAQAEADGPFEVVTQYDESQLEFPEGIAVDKRGDIYVGLAPLGEIHKFRPRGIPSLFYDFGGVPGEIQVIGLAVDAPGNVYVCVLTDPYDPMTQGVWRINRDGEGMHFAGTEAILFPNALAFDKRGYLYVTDSVRGAIWRVPKRGPAELWVQHELLEGTDVIPGYPPIGANGIAFRHSTLYVANTEKGHIVRIPVLPDGSAGEAAVVAYEGLFGLDGIALDVHGNIYAALILQNMLVRIDPTDGDVTVLATADDGLDEPASLAFGSGKGERQSVYLTNYSLLPPHDGFGPAVLKFDAGVPGLPLP